MHISDGVLSGPVLVATNGLAVVGVGIGLHKMDYEHAARVGVLSAVFFVASLVHVPIPPASAHLLLIGLMGFLLGWAAFPALAVALLLQAIIFGLGGLTSLGANVLIMGIPAMAVHYLFAWRVCAGMPQRPVFALAFAAGVAGIVLTCATAGVVLFAAGKEFVGAIGMIALGHVPVAVIEGFVTGSAVAFLYRVRPAFLEAPLRAHAGKEAPVG